VVHSQGVLTVFFSFPSVLAATSTLFLAPVAVWLQLVDQVTSCQERFDFNEAGQALYSWAWGEFADW
jgi:hypothetical protein